VAHGLLHSRSIGGAVTLYYLGTENTGAMRVVFDITGTVSALAAAVWGVLFFGMADYSYTARARLHPTVSARRDGIAFGLAGTF
jgi:hypothetical protein